jgi:hypothetical protein
VLDEAEKIAPTRRAGKRLLHARGVFERQKKVEQAEANSAKCWLQPRAFGRPEYLGYMLVDHKLRVEEAQMIRRHWK